MDAARRVPWLYSHLTAALESYERAESLHIHTLRPPAITTPTAFTQTGIRRPAMSTSACVIIRRRWPRQTSAKTVPATRSPKTCDFMFVSSCPSRTGLWQSGRCTLCQPRPERALLTLLSTIDSQPSTQVIRQFVSRLIQLTVVCTGHNHHDDPAVLALLNRTAELRSLPPQLGDRGVDVVAH